MEPIRLEDTPSFPSALLSSSATCPSPPAAPSPTLSLFTFSSPPKSSAPKSSPAATPPSYPLLGAGGFCPTQPGRGYGIVGYTTGTYDSLHHGHCRILQHMKQRVKILIVGLTSDRLAMKQKRPAIMSYEQRKGILDAIKYVDFVVEHDGDPKSVAWEKLKFDILFIGDDYFGTEEYSLFEMQHPEIPVIYIPRTPHISTSQLLGQGAIENPMVRLNDLKILKQGVNGPIFHFSTLDSTVSSSKDQKGVGNMILKQVSAGRSEWLAFPSTSDIYQLGFPRPRNWKRVPPLSGNGQKDKVHPNISGVNTYRELGIYDYLKDLPFYPVINIRQIYEGEAIPPIPEGVELATASSFKSPGKSVEQSAEVARLLAERVDRPHAIYWILQRYCGPTLHDWLSQSFPSVTFAYDLKIKKKQVEGLCRELHVRGIVHGDIHSRNICFDSHGTVSLLDYGWCLHASFDMDDEEKAEYHQQLAERFDYKHFLESLEWDLAELRRSGPKQGLGEKLRGAPGLAVPTPCDGRKGMIEGLMGPIESPE